MTTDNIKDKEAYENYLELKKLGVRLVKCGLVESSHFVGLARKNEYELDSKFRNKIVKIIPYYHSKRVVQMQGDISSPKVVTFQKYKIFKQSAADSLSDNLEIMIGNVFNDKDSYIELHKTPVECEMYEVFRFLVRNYEKFKIQIREDNQIHLIPRLAYKSKENVEKIIEKTPSLSDQEKEILSSNMEFIES